MRFVEFRPQSLNQVFPCIDHLLNIRKGIDSMQPAAASASRDESKFKAIRGSGRSHRLWMLPVGNSSSRRHRASRRHAGPSRPGTGPSECWSAYRANVNPLAVHDLDLNPHVLNDHRNRAAWAELVSSSR